MSIIKRIVVLSLLVLILCGMGHAQTPPPILFVTDIDSGPNSGGETNGGFSGAYVTLYGNFFGSSQGTSTITWNGLSCLRVVPTVGSYNGWGSTYLWYQKLIVQIGSSCTAGTGNFVITTPAGTSNGIPFTVRAGNIFCVSTTGNDANGGTFPSSCWATIPKGARTIAAGDIVYIENGVVQTATENFNAMVWIGGDGNGTAGNPKAVVGYPGALAQVGACTNADDSYGFRGSTFSVPNNDYWTIAEMKACSTGRAIGSQSVNHWRIVGNELTCPFGTGSQGCFEPDSGNFWAVYANNMHDTGTNTKFYHGFYFSTDVSHVDLGWNQVANITGCRGIQFHSSPIGGSTGQNQFDILVHDNLVHDVRCDGINLATIDPSQGAVKVYNNIVYNSGQGPMPADSGCNTSTPCGNFACIYFPDFTNNGPTGSGTSQVYNNTLYNCSSIGVAGVGAGNTNLLGAINKGGGNTSLFLNLTNNIIDQVSQTYLNSSGGQGFGQVAGVDNLWFGNGTPPTQTTSNLNVDPKFANTGTNDFHLQAASPAIHAGTNTQTSFADYSGITRPNPPSLGALEPTAIPIFIYSNAAPVATPNLNGPWIFDSTCNQNSACYRVPLDPNMTTAGSTLILTFGYDSTGANQVFLVTDDKGNTWTLDVTSSVSNNKTLKMYHASNIAAGTSYVNVRLTSGTDNAYWQPTVTEFYNVGAVDGTSCNAGSSTSVTAGSITPTQPGDLLFQAKYSTSITSTNLPPSQTANFTPGSQANISWALSAELLSDGTANQYGVYNSTSAINPTLTQAASDNYLSCAVAFKASTTGSAPVGTLQVIHHEHDAMPHNAAGPYVMGMIVTAGSAVYISSVENDSINNSGITSVPAPTVGWTRAGADFAGLNGHNHSTNWCAQYSSSGPVLISVARSGTSNDGIFMIYDVLGGTCNIDVDSVGQTGIQNSTGPLAACSGCLTPTHQNDIIFGYGGQFACTGTGVNPPVGGIWDAVWFTGNYVDGPSQTDENNFWMHYYNGASLSPISVTWSEACDVNTQNWASRFTAWQSAVVGTPAVSLVPSSLSFGNQFTSTVSPIQIITLTNTGTATLTITSAVLTGANSGDFTISSSTCGASLGAGNNCTYSLSFIPTILGPRSASLTITDNAAGSPHAATLSGNGVHQISGNGKIGGTGVIKVAP